MAEWIYEDGIGEARAILVAEGTILEALIEWDDSRWTVGTITDARMGEIDRAHGRAFVILPDDTPAILSPLPTPAPSQGASCRVEVTREPMRERQRQKWPKVRFADPDAQPRPGPRLIDLVSPARTLLAHHPDLFEAAGWSELLEEAATGEIGFPGGTLHVSLTPAMTLIDVDGSLPRTELAVAGALAAAKAIRRLRMGGSIGIDLPTLDSKAARQEAAGAFDAALPQPFERTAVNGYGFMQVIRRRDRRSIPEILASDPDGAAARALLRRAERCGGRGALTLTAAPSIVARLEREPAWLDDLARRAGRPLILRAEAGLSRWEGHVDAQTP